MEDLNREEIQHSKDIMSDPQSISSADHLPYQARMVAPAYLQGLHLHS